MMKLLIMSCLFIGIMVSCQDEKQVKNVVNDTQKLSDSNLPKEIQEEDCDDKLKKIEEKIPEEPNLLGGDTGCSLDEINQ